MAAARRAGTDHHGDPAGRGRARRTGGAVLLALGLAGSAVAQPVEPSAARALALVREHRTNGFTTVGRTLAYAERMRPGSFRLAPAWAGRRAGWPVTRVHLCYRLTPEGRAPERRCDITYQVSADPPHVELVEPQAGLGRELEAGREHFLRGLDRERALRRDPAAAAIRDALEPFDPYDRR